MDERNTAERNGNMMHRAVITDRRTASFTGVLDVLSFDMTEILLETEQGMLNIKGRDLHVGRLSLEQGEVDIDGDIDALTYSEVPGIKMRKDTLFGKLLR